HGVIRACRTPPISHIGAHQADRGLIGRLHPRSTGLAARGPTPSRRVCRDRPRDEELSVSSVGPDSYAVQSCLTPQPFIGRGYIFFRHVRKLIYFSHTPLTVRTEPGPFA